MKRVSRGIAPLFLLLPSASWALGLGEIRVETALNEPLVAEIPVLSASKKDLRDMKVRLAPAAAFKKLGLDRSYVLTQLRFTPTTVHGRPVIRITSKKPVREPFLDFLIEVDWPKGRLVREYTVLLDPPALLAKKAPPAVSPARTAGGTYGFEQPQAPAASYGGPREVRGQWPEAVRVRPGDSLYKIAKRLDPGASGVGLHQLMVALYRANPQAFGGNMNLLRAGARLTVPPRAEVASIDPQTARTEVAQQTRQWRKPRPIEVAEAESEAVPQPSSRPETQPAAEAPAAPAEGQQTEPVTGQASEEISGQLKILAGGEAEGAAGGGTGVGESSATQEDVQTSLALAREVAKAREEENVALKTRLAQLEEMLKRSERIIELQNRELETLRERISRLEAGLGGTEGVVESSTPAGPEAGKTGASSGAEPSAATKQAAVAQEPQPPVQDQHAASEPYALLDVLMSNPLVLFGLGGSAALLLLLGLWASRRRGGAPEPEPEAAAQAPGPLAAGALATSALATRETAEAISTGMFEAAQTAPTAGPEQGDALELEGTEKAAPEAPAEDELSPVGATSEAEDVLSEADVYIAYGLYQQAEELLQEALDQDPGNADFYVKLAETYQREERPEALAALAKRMQEAGLASGEAWERVAALGRKLEPDNPAYAAGAEGEVGTPAADVEPEAEQAVPDSAETASRELETAALQPAEEDEDELTEAFSETARVEAPSGPERTAELELPDELKDLDEGGPGASNILEFDADDLGFQAEPEGAEDTTSTLAEEIRSELQESEGGLDLDLTDANLRVPEGLDPDRIDLDETAADLPGPEETVELDETLLQELETAITEMQDADAFRLPEESADEGSGVDTLLLDQEAPEAKEAGEKDKEPGQEPPTEAIDDVLELDTLMRDQDKMTFQVEEPTEIRQVRTGTSDTELFDTALARKDADLSNTELIDSDRVGDDADTVVTDTGFTDALRDRDEAETKLELARAYLEMGDKEGAKATLEEVLESDNELYRQQAQELMRGLG